MVCNYSTDRTCDWGLKLINQKLKNATVTTNPALVGVHLTGVTIPNTDISNEDLLLLSSSTKK